MNYHRLNTRYAFSLTEVIVATMVFSVAMAGVFAVTNYVGRKQDTQMSGTDEVQATLFGQQVLDQLRRCVDGDGAVMNQANCLPIGGPYTQVSSDGKYTATYSIVDDNGGRKVDMDVTW